MACTTHRLNRRRFCLLLVTLVAATGTPACSTIQPRPFATGQTVTPPWGCTDLLRRNPQGDC